jgi:hypothetical protein
MGNLTSLGKKWYGMNTDEKKLNQCFYAVCNIP